MRPGPEAGAGLPARLPPPLPSGHCSEGLWALCPAALALPDLAAGTLRPFSLAHLAGMPTGAAAVPLQAETVNLKHDKVTGLGREGRL